MNALSLYVTQFAKDLDDETITYDQFMDGLATILDQRDERAQLPEWRCRGAGSRIQPEPLPDYRRWGAAKELAQWIRRQGQTIPPSVRGWAGIVTGEENP